MSSDTGRPLEGIRVLDLTVALAGPYGSMLLGGLGAEVIRIEAPGGSDLARSNPPFATDSGISFESAEPGDVSLTLLNRGRNKKSITLDLKCEEGVALFKQLVAASDVVIENMSEGVTARLGVDYASLRKVNDRIVYASIKAFGEPSSYPHLKGMDIIVQALSGLMEVTGEPDAPPTRCGLPIADLLAPLYAVNGLLAALIRRGQTGKGQHVQVSMLDCLTSWIAEEHFDVMSAAGYPLRSGNFHDRLVPFGIYPSLDGFVAIAAVQSDWFKGLMDAMGRADLQSDSRFRERGPRMANAVELNRLISAWTQSRSTMQIVDELAIRRRVPAAPVRSPLEALSDPKLLDSGAVMKLKHPRLADKDFYGMGLPIKFSECHAQFDHPAEALGESNFDVFGGVLGLTPQQVTALQARRII